MGKITIRARKLRNNSTTAEQIFWNEIRSKKTGFKFLRQKPLRFYYGNIKRFFIADFFCKELKLVIEIDGKIHENQQEYDFGRTYILNEMGYKVIRFTNEQIINNVSNCLSLLPLPRFSGEREMSATGGQRDRGLKI